MEYKGAIYVQKFRKETSRLASMANKRIERLEKSNLKTSPAYRKWIDAGGQKFGVKGKTFNEVQAEMARLRRFIDSETSTVRGVNRTLKNMADATGIEYNNLTDLQKKSENFFELANKIEQYLRTMDDIATAIGYQKIWTAINEYVESTKVDLADSSLSIEELTENISEILSNSSSAVDEKHAITGEKMWILLK